MSNKEIGVYQLENGNWEYRFAVTKNGKKTNYRKRKDENGNVFKTQAQAKRARAAALKKLKKEEPALMHRAFGTATVSKVYEEYCETGRFDKAYATIKKQDSLWRNHSLIKGFQSFSEFESNTINKEPSKEDYFLLKQAVLSTHHGIEILFKYVLNKKSEFLIVSKIDNNYMFCYEMKEKHNKSNVDDLRKYKSLLDEGLITESDYESIKKKILNL